MSNPTLEIYDRDAKRFADRFEDMVPERTYELALAFFRKGKPTLDIGCGSGRDTAYLTSHGFPTTGIDGSSGMLEEARLRRPELTLRYDTLPELATVPPNSVTNLFSSAVLMHLPEAELVKAIVSLLRVLESGGRAVISFRGPGDAKADHGRLFTRISASQLAELFESLGGKVLLIDQQQKQNLWHYLVVEKTGIEHRDGIARIQEIITNDNKTATYKLALLRALCDLARNESHTVIWEPELDFVIVPLERLALSWLRYYWAPIQKGVRQIRSSPNLAFASEVKALQELYPNPRDAILNYESGKPSAPVLRALKKIANTINGQPVRYAGGGATPVFGQSQTFTVCTDQPWKNQWYSLKGIKVPSPLWRDIRLFHHWIEKSLIVEWVELTSERLDPTRSAAEIFKLFFDVDYDDKRTTAAIRKIFAGESPSCIWTGKRLRDFDVDHVIPYALWRNNDLWNLLPADRKINNSKRMLLPHPDLLRRRSPIILETWGRYRQTFGDRFERQVVRALGRSRLEFSLEDTLDQLVLVSAQLHNSRAVPYFSA